VVAHTFNPSTREAEADRFLSSRTVRANRETLSQKTKKQTNKQANKQTMKVKKKEY
jgi:hypothetical protein